MIPLPSLTGGRSREHSRLAKASVENIKSNTYLVGKDLKMSNSGIDSLERVQPPPSTTVAAAGANYLAGKESINGSGNARFWPSQPGEFKYQHLLPLQQVSKNHIFDGPPCRYEDLIIQFFGLDC